MFPNEDSLGLRKDTPRLEPTAPPLGDGVFAPDELNELNREGGSPKRPDILMNIPNPVADPEKCESRLIPAEGKPDAHQQQQQQGPWKTKNLGELVNDEADPVKSKRKRQRKLKKALGWAFWLTCAPLAVIVNLMRDQPLDRDDPLDWNNDPLRPWNYRVGLDTRGT